MVQKLFVVGDRGVVLQGDGYQRKPVSPCGAYKTFSVGNRISGLNAHGALVIPQKLVVVGKYTSVFLAVATHFKAFRRRYLTKQGIFHGFGGNKRKLVGGGVVVGIVKTVRVGKMGVLKPHFLCTGVHHANEAFDASADADGNCRCRIVSAFQQKTV